MPWGWLKRGTDPRLVSMVSGTGLGTSTVNTVMYPGSGLSSEINLYTCRANYEQILGLQSVLLELFRRREEWLNALFLLLPLGGGKTVDLSVLLSHAGEIPGVLIGRTRGTIVITLG